jgi:ferric-dicitrate binding protein FerR (iron transport regulator)
MSSSDRDDELWNAAWEWVIREHEQPLEDAARAELVQWLKVDPKHLQHYEEAHRVWLAAALLPPPACDDGNESVDPTDDQER